MLARTIALTTAILFGAGAGCLTDRDFDPEPLPTHDGEAGEALLDEGGGSDLQPTPVPPEEAVPPLVEEVAGPQGIVAHDGFLYYVARDGSALRRVPTSGGGEAETLVVLDPPVEAASFALAVGDAGAFVSDPAGAAVLGFDLAGEPVLAASFGDGAPLALALDGELLYAGTTAGDLVEVDLAAAGAVRVAAQVPGQVAALAVDGGYLYAATGDGSVYSVERAGGGAMLMADGMDLGAGITAGGGYVYFADDHAEGIFRAAPGATLELLAHDQKQTVGLALYRDALFFTGGADRKIKRVAAGGGYVQTLAFDEWGPELIAADRANVFWSSPKVRAILQLTAD